MAAPVTSRRRLSPEDRRAEILAVAQTAFSSGSYAQVSLARIAQASGASPSLIVFHFGSKRALYLECLTLSGQRMMADLLEVAESGAPDRLTRAMRRYVEHAATYREGFLALLRGGQESGFPEAAEAIENVRATVTDWLLGHFGRAGDVAAELAVRGYIGYLDTITIHWLSLPDEQRECVSPAAVAAMATAALEGGLAQVAQRD